MDFENLQKIIGLRHKLHQNAELSGKEEKTQRILQEFLAENTSLKIVQKNGWFYAIKKGSGKKSPVAFRADMDALPIPESLALPYVSQNPGVSHKCGHDGHMAALCGFACELEKIAPENLVRDIYLVFQPAEEIGAGAKICAEEIFKLGVREVYAYHNLPGYKEGSVVYRPGETQPASEGFSIFIKGRESHAAYPEQGANPGILLSELIKYAANLPQIINSDGMCLCTLVYANLGSKNMGISAGNAVLTCTLRAEKEDDMFKMENLLKKMAENLAKSQFQLSYQVDDYFPGTKNTELALKKVLQSAKNLGLVTICQEKMWRASEDFGYYTKKMDGAIFYLGDGENYPDLHTVNYDFNDKILENAVNMFLGILQID